jgi:hypothetical protein
VAGWLRPSRGRAPGGLLPEPLPGSELPKRLNHFLNAMALITARPNARRPVRRERRRALRGLGLSRVAQGAQPRQLAP